MSLKNSYVTSDYLEWDSMLSLVRKLYRDQEYRLSLLIGCGSFFGLRISDLLTLTWSMLLDNESLLSLNRKLASVGRLELIVIFKSILQTVISLLV